MQHHQEVLGLPCQLQKIPSTPETRQEIGREKKKKKYVHNTEQKISKIQSLTARRQKLI